MSSSKNISAETTPNITPRLRPKTRHQADRNDGEGDDAVVPLSSLSIGTKRGRAASSGKVDSGTAVTRSMGSGGGGDTPVSATRDTSQAHHIRGGEWVERRLASVPMVPLTVPFTVGCVSVNEKAPTTGEVQQLEERRKRLGLSSASATALSNMETTKTTGEHKERTHRFYVYVAPTASFSDPVNTTTNCSASSMDDTLAALFYAMVDRVEFVLNPSFQYRRRVCRTPPFVMQENAWGESVIDVVVFLKRAHQHIPQSLGSGGRGGTAKKKSGEVTSRIHSNDEGDSHRHLFTSPPDAALPIKASKMVRSFVGALNLGTSSSSSLSTGGDPSDREKLLYYLPTSTATNSSSSKNKVAENNSEDENEDVPEEVDTVNVSGLNDANTQYSTFLMSQGEEKEHSEGFESTIIARIRSHLQRPVIDSQTHPALPSLRVVPTFSSVPLVPHSVTKELITSSSEGEVVNPSSLVLEDRLRNFDAKFVKQYLQATTAKTDVTSASTTAPTSTSAGHEDRADASSLFSPSEMATSAALKHLASIPPVSIPFSSAHTCENMDRLLVFDDRRDAPVVNERQNGITIYCSVPSLVNKELSEDYTAMKQRNNNTNNKSLSTTTSTTPTPSPKHKASAQLLKWVQRFIAEGLEEQRRHQMLRGGGNDAVDVERPHALLAPVPRLPTQVRKLIATGREVALRSFSAINVAPSTSKASVKTEVSADTPLPLPSPSSSNHHEQHMNCQNGAGGVGCGIACPAAAHLAQYILRLLEEERELMRRFVEVDTAVSDLWEPMAADLITSIAQQLKSETFDKEMSQ